MYTVKEGKRQFLKFTMTYSADWSVADKQGDPVISSEVTNIYFIVKKTDKSETVVFTKSVGSGIVWVDSPTGLISVEFGSETLGKAGNYRYELVAKLPTNVYVSIERGDLIIEKSIAGNPT